MIGLCRALNIPARFVTGIDYGADVALGPTDFHAYTEVFLGDRWYIVDATGISPSTGLLRLGTGRDAADAAFATIYGDIVSWAPAVEILATFDLSRGILLPERTLEPVSTAGLDSAAAAEALAASQAVEPLAVGTFQSNERSGSGQHSSH
jgi:transglutaminase-like putative cysteine protease